MPVSGVTADHIEGAVQHAHTLHEPRVAAHERRRSAHEARGVKRGVE